MSNSDATVLILGGTGQTGKLIVPLLLDAGFNVRAVVRSPERAALPTSLGAYVSHERFTLYKGDLTDQSSIETALHDVATPSLYAVLATGASGGSTEAVELGGVQNVVAALKQVGSTDDTDSSGSGSVNVNGIVAISSAGTTRPWHPIVALLNTVVDGVLMWKLRAEDVLRRSGLNYVIVRPSGLTNGERVVPSITQDDTEMTMCPRSTVADAVLASLGHIGRNGDATCNTGEVANANANADTSPSPFRSRVQLTFEMSEATAEQQAEMGITSPEQFDWAPVLANARPDSELRVATLDLDATCASHRSGKTALMAGTGVVLVVAVAGVVALVRRFLRKRK